MLGSHKAVATLAVRDIGAARRFYEGTLGLRPVDAEGDDLVTYGAGDSVLNVYRSPYAGTNQATAMTWVVGEGLEDEVRVLHDKGVAFEHYDDLPGMTRDGDIHRCGDLRVAWFKDPDGNILNLVSG